MSIAFDVLDRLVSFYGLLIVAYIILSWFPVREGFIYEVYRVLGTVCEPYIGIFRRIVPTASVGGAGIDFSPLVAYLVLQYLIRGMLLPLLR